MDPKLTSAVKSEDTVTDERVGLFTPATKNAAQRTVRGVPQT